MSAEYRLSIKTMCSWNFKVKGRMTAASATSPQASCSGQNIWSRFQLVVAGQFAEATGAAIENVGSRGLR